MTGQRIQQEAIMPVFHLLTGAATHCTDKREFGTEDQCQISRLLVQKCGNAAHKTVNISNFAHKFSP